LATLFPLLRGERRRQQDDRLGILLFFQSKEIKEKIEAHKFNNTILPLLQNYEGRNKVDIK
jgi:hypothetical protein